MSKQFYCEISVLVLVLFRFVVVNFRCPLHFVSFVSFWFSFRFLFPFVRVVFCCAVIR